VLVSVVPCPNPAGLDTDRAKGQRAPIESVESAAASPENPHLHHHETAEAGAPESHARIARHGNPVMDGPRLHFVAACMCGCGDAKESVASGGKLGPQIVSSVDELSVSEVLTLLMPLQVPCVEGLGEVPDLVPIPSFYAYA
jgi:hypothetical protein